jgi:hypothetical protein
VAGVTDAFAVPETAETEADTEGEEEADEAADAATPERQVSSSLEPTVICLHC